MSLEVWSKVPARVRAELQELHEETLPADSVPSFRGVWALLVRDATGSAVAYVTWKPGGRYRTLDRIGVAAEWRQGGVAGRLLDRALTTLGAEEWRTYIAAHNIASQRLFISRGFVPYAHFSDGATQFIRFKRGPHK